MPKLRQSRTYPKECPRRDKGCDHCERDNHVESNCFIKYPHLKTKLLKLQKANYNITKYRKKRHTYEDSSSDDSYDSYNSDSSSEDDNRYNNRRYRRSKDRYRKRKGRYRRNNNELSEICLATIDETFQFDKYFSADEKHTEYDTDSDEDDIDETSVDGLNENFLGDINIESDNRNDSNFISINNNFLADYKHNQLELIEEEPDDYKDFEWGSVIDSTQTSCEDETEEATEVEEHSEDKTEPKVEEQTKDVPKEKKSQPATTWISGLISFIQGGQCENKNKVVKINWNQSIVEHVKQQIDETVKEIVSILEESKSNNNNNTWYNNDDEVVDQFEDEDELLWEPTLTTKPNLNSNNKSILELGSEDNDKTPTFKAVVMKGTEANKVETIKIIRDGKEHERNENNNKNRKPKKTTSILKTKIIHDGKEYERKRKSK